MRVKFPSIDIYDRCIKTIGNNQFETDEITASGLTAEKASKVNAPQIKECFWILNVNFYGNMIFEGSQEVAAALKAVSICIDSERYDQSKLGRYGKNGYLYQIDQPDNPETGEITPINHGTLEPGVPIEWITN